MILRKVKEKPGYPWMVMVHGLGGSGAVWRQQIKALANRYSIALVELHKYESTYEEERGQKTEQATFKEKGCELGRLMEKAGIEKAYFIGMSLGSLVISGLRAEHPEKVISVVYGGPVMLRKRCTFLKATLGCIERLSMRIPYKVIVLVGSRIIVPIGFRAGRNLYVRSAKRLSNLEFSEWFSLLAREPDMMNCEREGCLVLVGEGDIWFREATQENMRKPGQEVVVIKDAGHICNIDAPQEFNEAVKEYFEKGRCRNGKD